jgi:hypothetical protein
LVRDHMLADTHHCFEFDRGIDSERKVSIHFVHYSEPPITGVFPRPVLSHRVRLYLKPI